MNRYLIFLYSKNYTRRLFRSMIVAIFILAGAVPTLDTMRITAASLLNVQIENGGTDSSQQAQFIFLVKNVSSGAQSNISVRVYFQVDGSQTASKYVFEKYWDQSGSGTISGPTLATGSTYYFTVNFGSALLAAGSSWQFNTALHLSDWTNNFDGSNDWWHTGFSVGSLPPSFTNTNNIPAYIANTLAWGVEPGGITVPTSTNTKVGPTSTSTNTKVGPTSTNTKAGPTSTSTNTTMPTFQPPSVTSVVTRVGPTATFTLTPTASATSRPGSHLANPFAGAKWYVNPDWAVEVNAEAAIQGGALGAVMSKVAKYNTAVWLDSIDAVNGTNGYPRSLAGHLDAALAQGANLISIVVYDLPNRDCSALSSNGELLIAQNGLNRYKTEYIDVIAATISQAKYASLRIVAVIEPDSLPNLITNVNAFPKCQEAAGAGGYVEGTQYTLNKLHPVSNFYAYIDIGHAGWLGWPSNFGPAITLISNMIKGTTAGVNSVDGFISNTANTSVATEPFMTANQQIGSSPVRSADFYSWNTYIEEDTYDAAWAAAMMTAGLPSTSVNMLIDTSRNGWGGCGGGPNVSSPCRPTGPSTSTIVNTFVDATRIDRRPAKGDWCNQNGAGIGAIPQANPPGGVYQAYLWIKPPGESDGSSSLIPTGPNNPGGKGFDRMCDPTYGGNALNNNKATNALPNAPVSGRWFEAQFVQLVQNAFPAIP